MHFQASEHDWPQALALMPDYSVIKAFDPSMLREAKQVWMAAGRDPKKLFTVYRHFDIQSAPAGSWESVKEHWRTMYKRFVDATYLSQYRDFVDYVSEANEYTATSTWQDPADKVKALMSCRGAAYIWNMEFRGKLVPSNCRVALLSGPVSNDIPNEIFSLAMAEDCPIDYHAYTRYDHGIRFSEDWKDDSGRWQFMEQRAGMKPDWLFGESGPYLNAFAGWRHPTVLGGDVSALSTAMRRWWTDLTTSTAYPEGRLIGAGCWFTSGHVGWEFYQLETEQLKLLANTLRPIWKPGVKMNDADKQEVALHANAILDVVNRLFQVKIKPGVTLNVRSGPGTTFADVGDITPNTVAPVFTVAANGWYRINRLEEKWISGSAQYSDKVV